MHLQGKDLVSQATQRSARALVATALVVVLAKHYAVLPADLELVGVKIGQTAVSGGIFWVVLFQTINHLIHWFGDYYSISAWNSKEKVNGIGRASAGSHILSKLEQTTESIECFLEARSRDTKLEGNYPDSIAKEIEIIMKQISDIKPSVKSYRTFGSLYFFGWFLLLPVMFAIAAIFWP
jgi:hypothetical protein